MQRVKGSCSQCGYCCKVVHIIFDSTESTKEWAKARGFRIVQDNGKIIEVSIPSPCPHFVEGTGCDLHDKFDEGGKPLKPAVCREYPWNMEKVWHQAGLDGGLSMKDSKGFKVEDDNQYADATNSEIP